MLLASHAKVQNACSSAFVVTTMAPKMAMQGAAGVCKLVWQTHCCQWGSDRLAHMLFTRTKVA